jgi:hypothetical protein
VLEDSLKEKSAAAPLPLTNGDGVTYTVPQRVRVDRVDKRVDVFFRVNRVCEESAVVVTSDGEELARYKRERLAPGEMERIALPKQILAKARGSMTIAIEEAAL